MSRIMNLSLWVLLAFSFSFVWNTDPIDPNSGASEEEVRWVDSVYESMTEDERLGQLFMIRAYSNKGTDHIAKVKKLIKDYKVGSLCFFQGTPEKQIELVNEYQAISDLPLMIAIDGEWG